MGDQERQYLRTDRHADLVSSVEHCARSVDLAKTNLREWKWCVLAGHSAAQAALVIRLSAFGSLDALDDKTKRKLVQHYDDETKPYPRLRLAEFDTLYDRVKAVEPTIAGTEIAVRLKRLGELRNGLSHFSLDGWSIEVALARDTVKAAIELVAALIHPEILGSEGDKATFQLAMARLQNELSTDAFDYRVEIDQELDRALEALTIATSDSEGDAWNPRPKRREISRANRVICRHDGEREQRHERAGTGGEELDPAGPAHP